MAPEEAVNFVLGFCFFSRRFEELFSGVDGGKFITRVTGCLFLKWPQK
jgi:hypothetical protein